MDLVGIDRLCGGVIVRTGCLCFAEVGLAYLTWDTDRWLTLFSCSTGRKFTELTSGVHMIVSGRCPSNQGSPCLISCLAVTYGHVLASLAKPYIFNGCNGCNHIFSMDAAETCVYSMLVCIQHWYGEIPEHLFYLFSMGALQTIR